MTHRQPRTLLRLLAVIAAAALMAGCAAGRAYGRGESATRAGDWDTAVEHYRRAVQDNPGRIDYRIALERAMRTGDPTGVAGRGLLGAVLFDAVGGGPANLTMTGSATGPSGTPVQLQFGLTPVVTVR